MLCGNVTKKPVVRSALDDIGQAHSARPEVGGVFTHYPTRDIVYARGQCKFPHGYPISKPVFAVFPCGNVLTIKAGMR